MDSLRGRSSNRSSARPVKNNSEYFLCCPYSFVLFLTLSISPHVPPERNPGQGHQIVADIRGRSTNNSSVTLGPFINIAGNYHSSPCTNVPNIVHNLRTLHSNFGLRVLPTSLIHTNKRSNILPILLQHKYTLQLTNNSFHSNTDSLYIIPPAIHTANRIANQSVPLASKPIPQVPDNLSDSPDITLQPARDLHFGGQSESSTEHIMSTDVTYATRTPAIPHGNQDVKLPHYTS